MIYKIEEMKFKELKETINLIKNVFDEFEAPDYNEEGIESFYKFANYDNIKELLNRNLKMLVAKDNKKIVGVIAFRDYCHISMLFVSKNYHRQGIARNLIKEMKYICRCNKKELDIITVNSSPYAIDFYHKMGFEDINYEQIVDGIRFTPMKLDIYYFDKYKEEFFEYLYRTKRDCFKWYVEKIYDEWNDEVQIKIFRDFINEHRDHINIIKYRNEVIGIYTNYIDENNESVVNLFYIDKKYQGRGIGTEILEEQLKIDKQKKVNTILQVFKDNPARFLYDKVGFRTYEETNTHYKKIRKYDE